MSFTLFIVLAFMTWYVWVFLRMFAANTRELGRFTNHQGDLVNILRMRFVALAEAVGARKANKSTMGYMAAKSDREMSKKLQQAGLESAVERGRFFLMKTITTIAGPVTGSLAYLVMRPYYATIIMLFASSAGILMPMLYLKMKIQLRNEDIQRELPLLLDLTNLGTSAGWDVGNSLERVVDALYVEFPGHPLMREMKRARWLTASGYTWEEALERMASKLDSDSVTRSTHALVQAMRQGGDRTSQLEGIAEDAQRQYQTDLDKRLASLPVKVLLITLMLMVAYFIMLLSPAAVQVKNILMG